jgi:SAM-dependent methyltransferase
VVNRCLRVPGDLVRFWYRRKVLRTLQTRPVPCPVCGPGSFTPLHERDRFGFPVRTQRCDGCGIVMINPQPTQQFLDLFYSSPMYRGLYSGLLRPDESFRRKRAPGIRQNVLFINRLLVSRPAPPPGPVQVLDFGSGDGGFLRELRRECPGVRLYGIERGEHQSDASRDELDGLFARIEELPPALSFDVITLWHVLEHVPDPVRVLSLLGKHLRPGGLLVVEVPDLAKSPGMKHVHIAHLYTFDRTTIRRFLERSGLRVLDLTDDYLQAPFGMKVVAQVSKGASSAG